MRSLLRYGLYLGASALMLLHGTNANAAEQIVLKSRIFRSSIPVSALSTLAQTGEVSELLQVYLERTQQNPESVRQVLTRSISVNPLILDRVLNSPIGDLILDEVSPILGSSSTDANRQALRSALVLSATGDGEISLIETIQNYPGQAIQLDVENLEDAYIKLQNLSNKVQAVLDILQIKIQ